MTEAITTHHSIAYRADIDGLRAISILLVIASHTLHIEAGNIGVDIFFAISGYVITMTIIKDYNKGTYSYANFYTRRIKRIFPSLYISSALFLVYVYLYFKQHLKLIAEMVFCNVLMIQNFCLLNYYENPQPGVVYGKMNLMSQNWTLGIEEQFYFLWPMIMAIIMKKQPKKRLIITGALATLSFMLMISPLIHHFAQFIPFCRFWQIFAGCFLALYQFGQKKQSQSETKQKVQQISTNPISENVEVSEQKNENRSLNQQNTPQIKSTKYQIIYILFNIGILCYVFLKKDRYSQILFYVVWTLAILKNKDTLFNTRFLSYPPLVYIGKLSYSIYIWHQAVITSYVRGYYLFAVGFAFIGLFSYYFIQNQLRATKNPFAVPGILIFGGIILVISSTLRFG